MDDTQQLTQSALIDMAVEGWRFSRLFNKVLNKLDAGDGQRHVNQLRYFLKKIEDNLDMAGLKLVNVEGQPYDAGIAATPLNIEDFESDDALIIEQMVEPIIMGSEGVIKSGTVMLRKIEQ